MKWKKWEGTSGPNTSPLEFINEAVKRLGFRKRNLQSTGVQNVSFLSVDFSLSQVLKKRRKHWKGRNRDLKGELTVGKAAQWFMMTVNREKCFPGTPGGKARFLDLCPPCWSTVPACSTGDTLGTGSRLPWGSA